MLLRRQVSPRTMVRIGMAALVVALLAQYFLKPTSAIGPDATDFWKGSLMGIAIGMNLIAVIANAHALRNKPR